MSLSPQPMQLESNTASRSPKVDPAPEAEEEEDVIQKLREVEILPQLFGLLQSLESGNILPRDFGNNAGSIRLKLNTLKQYLQEVEGINETIEERIDRIEYLRARNRKKSEFLRMVKERVAQVNTGEKVDEKDGNNEESIETKESIKEEVEEKTEENTEEKVNGEQKTEETITTDVEMKD